MSAVKTLRVPSLTFHGSAGTKKLQYMLRPNEKKVFTLHVPLPLSHGLSRATAQLGSDKNRVFLALFGIARLVAKRRRGEAGGEDDSFP